MERRGRNGMFTCSLGHGLWLLVVMKQPVTVWVDPGGRGAWDVALPDADEHIICETLEEASKIAYRCAADRRPSELIVRDAYHRVLRREQISGQQ